MEVGGGIEMHARCDDLEKRQCGWEAQEAQFMLARGGAQGGSSLYSFGALFSLPFVSARRHRGVQVPSEKPWCKRPSVHG